MSVVQILSTELGLGQDVLIPISYVVYGWHRTSVFAVYFVYLIVVYVLWHSSIFCKVLLITTTKLCCVSNVLVLYSWIGDMCSLIAYYKWWALFGPSYMNWSNAFNEDTTPINEHITSSLSTQHSLVAVIMWLCIKRVMVKGCFLFYRFPGSNFLATLGISYAMGGAFVLLKPAILVWMAGNQIGVRFFYINTLSCD